MKMVQNNDPLESVVASRGGMGAVAPPSQRLCPPLAPPVTEKNGQNKLFSANFWIFAPSESHFAPRCPHKKKK